MTNREKTAIFQVVVSAMERRNPAVLRKHPSKAAAFINEETGLRETKWQAVREAGSQVQENWRFVQWKTVRYCSEIWICDLCYQCDRGTQWADPGLGWMSPVTQAIMQATCREKSVCIWIRRSALQELERGGSCVTWQAKWQLCLSASEVKTRGSLRGTEKQPSG